MKKRLSESKAITILNKNGAEIKNKVIIAKEGVKGLTACSAIDYLCNFCGYIARVG